MIFNWQYFAYYSCSHVMCHCFYFCSALMFSPASLALSFGSSCTSETALRILQKQLFVYFFINTLRILQKQLFVYFRNSCSYTSSETLFVYFRNTLRILLQKHSSYTSETLFVYFRNSCSYASETALLFLPVMFMSSEFPAICTDLQNIVCLTSADSCHIV